MGIISHIVKLRLVVNNEACGQEWCCVHHGRGCTQTLGSALQCFFVCCHAVLTPSIKWARPEMDQSSFDCSTDLYHWHQRWSDEKKVTIGACDEVMGSIARKAASYLQAEREQTWPQAASKHVMWQPED